MYNLFFKMFRGQRLIYIPEALVKSRRHQNQTTHTFDKTISECETLWKNMFQSLTCEEMSVIGGSTRHFWIKQAPFMKNVTPYVKATEYAFERLKESTDELRAGLISIITPFYNRIYQVIECIKSVQRQSYQNWELILVNDGSTEDIGEIEKHIALENRVKLINLEKNMGVAHARNTGLNAVTGKFIAFLDSDDTWDPLKLDKQLKFMLENNYCVSHTNYNRVDINGNLLKKVDLSNMAGDIFSYSLFSCGIGTPCVIVDREFWGDLRFPQGIDYGEDICVWLELAWRGEWGHLPEALTSVCVRTDSTYKDTYKQQLGYAEILRYVLKRPRWASYQYEIGILAHDFDNLFPKRKNDESIKINFKVAHYF
jgi:glycosyltransferase involved in cell wall biosynthesis